MRHRKKGRKLGRSLRERTALMRKLARSLVLNNRIVTTEAKAKELRPLVERHITRARKGTLAARRILGRDYAPDVVRKLVDDIAPRYAQRPGGYTRITKLPSRRSDRAAMAVIEFVS